MNDQPPTPRDHEAANAFGAGASNGLARLLVDSTLWEDSDAADEAAILDAIVSLRASSVAPAEAGAVNRSVIRVSRSRRWIGPFVAGIAAALALVVGVASFVGSDDRSGVELTLAGTDLAPEAEGLVEIFDTPNGTVLLLDVSGLPPAAEGTYYEAWVRQGADIGVSAGTFHLRGGGGEIELWTGVTTEDYPLFTVTIQNEADPVSSGRVVLRGLLGE